jgi:chemotaxis protein methyltransferase CheR
MTISAGDFWFIRDLVRQRAAIVVEDGKEYLVESRLSTLARDEGFGSLDELIGQLRDGPPNGLHRKAVEAMATNETTFFRDMYSFEALRDTILPELISRKAPRRQLSIWCAGCSSGQEPYTIAMLIREHFPALAGWEVRLLATDLSVEVLGQARRGSYSQLEVNRGLPASYLVKYFTKQDLRWQLSPEIRRMVEFRELNLLDSWSGLPNMDLIFVRNVLIYFDVSTKKSILARIRGLLEPEGHLFLGGAETTLHLDDAYERVLLGRAATYRLRRPLEG